MTKEVENYCTDSGCYAYYDMVRDMKFQYLGVVPLWTDAEEAWDWFSEKFVKDAGDLEYQAFMKGWNNARTSS